MCWWLIQWLVKPIGCYCEIKWTHLSSYPVWLSHFCSQSSSVITYFRWQIHGMLTYISLAWYSDIWSDYLVRVLYCYDQLSWSGKVFLFMFSGWSAFKTQCLVATQWVWMDPPVRDNTTSKLLNQLWGSSPKDQSKKVWWHCKRRLEYITLTGTGKINKIRSYSQIWDEWHWRMSHASRDWRQPCSRLWMGTRWWATQFPQGFIR